MTHIRIRHCFAYEHLAFDARTSHDQEYLLNSMKRRQPCFLFLCNIKAINISTQINTVHERTTTAKNMGILKYHQTSLISYERGWPLACLDGLIKPNQASHQGARWTSSVSMLKVLVLALIIETSAVIPWCRRSFQDICRRLWIIIAELTCGLFPMIFRMVFPSCYHI
jgi:hypothetical protein